ncbi:MAG: hypothetical protein GY696_34795 [Gammaproteobacteria bacterium]|nr:hypothetical protein [Gammaproteobacteria bacterium]
MNNMKKFFAVPEDVLKRQEDLLRRQTEIMESGANLREVETSPESLQMTKMQTEMRRTLEASDIPTSKRLQVLDDMLQYYKQLDDARPLVTSVVSDGSKGSKLLLPKVGDTRGVLASKNWSVNTIHHLLNELPPTMKAPAREFLRQLYNNASVRFNIEGDLLAENGEPIIGANVAKLVRFFNTRHNSPPGAGEIALAEMMAKNKHSVTALGNRSLIPMIYPAGVPPEAGRYLHGAPTHQPRPVRYRVKKTRVKPRMPFTGPLFPLPEEDEWHSAEAADDDDDDDLPPATPATPRKRKANVTVDQLQRKSIRSGRNIREPKRFDPQTGRGASKALHPNFIVDLP